jgi:hypothetical protein
LLSRYGILGMSLRSGLVREVAFSAPERNRESDRDSDASLPFKLPAQESSSTYRSSSYACLHQRLEKRVYREITDFPNGVKTNARLYLPTAFHRETASIPHHALLMSSIPFSSRENLRGQPGAYVPSRLKYVLSIGTSDLQVGHALFPFSSNHFVM